MLDRADGIRVAGKRERERPHLRVGARPALEASRAISSEQGSKRYLLIAPRTLSLSSFFVQKNQS